MKYSPVLAVLAVLCLLTVASFQRAEDPPAKPASAPAKAKAGDYPLLDPFTESRMFKVFAEDIDKVDLDACLKDIRDMAEIMESSRKAAEGDKAPKPTEVGAFLQPPVEDTIRPRYAVLPVAMMKLAPLWSAESWTKDQLATAASTATFLAGYPDAPKLAFQDGKATENHAQIEKLARWFEKQVAKPELYAAMIITMDDGPFAGLPCAKKDVLPAKSSVVLDEKSKLELHLCRDETLPEPWILQAVKNDKLLWSRVFSGSPRGRIKKAELVDESRRWDGYGFKAFVQVEWTYGSEMSYVYLDPKAGMLFYFVSW